MSEKVEVIIKIPKYYLTHPQDYSCLAECVRRGVPLPKGHGRLIDYDDLIEQLDRYGRKNVKYQLPYSPTIIFADKESEECR